MVINLINNAFILCLHENTLVLLVLGREVKDKKFVAAEKSKN